ncbi:very short patch repair endonuclease [Hyphobacterium marinum]|uniref:Very short patch repair endonuclease n=1 Tax=Hyphobacterium marinum TaxID=3116574 RepID=A0ABU7LVA3_9PROT|nr:DNA mismatch endonuclease Vsr [Hyphobacterium sp. Y6023]MEE2565464.1 DNA mismatch endonuclease Vsr [Hyphobacterium sp. Y6023]
MTDIVSAKVRSRMMSGIRGKDTKPEMIVRRGLHARGFRFRLHDKRLPGKPDLVLPKYRTVIFVHGCFWHRHDCKYFKWPATRPEFWHNKIRGNVERDKKHIKELDALGWQVLFVWECELKSKSPNDISGKLDLLAQEVTRHRLSGITRPGEQA